MDIAVFMLKTAIEVGPGNYTQREMTVFQFLPTFPHLICHSSPHSLNEYYHTPMEHSQLLISHSLMEHLS